VFMSPAGTALHNEHPLSQSFGARLKFGVSLARYTAARVGGPAEAFLVVNSVDELASAVTVLWETRSAFTILGGGSNVLVSDAGVAGTVILNRARRVRFDGQAEPPAVWAEAGANFGSIARQAAVRGFSGLEWAAGIPGTLGGAVVGNAGAHGGDMASNLLVAEILHRNGQREAWTVERMRYAYRSSALKRQEREVVGQPNAIVLAARLRLSRSTPDLVQSRINELVDFRRRTQPPGASMGSMFKNPARDYAGRLIEAAGLKGARVGGAQISTLHANFFINQGQASAKDIYHLIQNARQEVLDQFGVRLELEIELLGNWDTFE